MPSLAGRFVLLAAAATAALGALPTPAQELSARRPSWTADQLYDDFLAQFGGDTKTCYTDYRLDEGPPLPDGPERAAPRWKKAVVAIDASGSMAGRAGGQRKMDAAKAAVREFLKTVPKDAEVGLLAFGHRGNNEESGKAASCNAVEMVSPLGTVEAAQVSRALDRFQATGWTPLAAAIAHAGSAFTPAQGAGEQVVFVVSDGLETCGGDPVAAARALHQSKVKAVINIIGFDVSAADHQALAAIAKAGGGAFSQASNTQELVERLRVRYANLHERQAFEQAALQALTHNNTDALSASNRANSCILEAVNRENTLFLDLSRRMVENGQIDAAASRAAQQRLRARHEALKAEMWAFQNRARSEMQAVNARIEARRERVKADYAGR
ncbi:MAG: VWA domain-containing protein [Pigmentiphaga sp.]|uniref:VWA domain-containing protein n=1 Tax=Pigmentiphaga sp. TaxID=1977564 RepID=UPI0029A224C6|nr:VWA domain-containing protein [Pigmentiphaga sp.]MDX3906591.1 VWA domain-containing protein [Pigmentiphaga sp.]